MKTITELNSKWWYRLAKVTFFLTFVAVTIATVNNTLKNESPYENLDPDNSYLVCTKGNLKKFSYSELDAGNFGGGRVSDQIVSEKCNIPEYTDSKEYTESQERFSFVRNNQWREEISNSYRLTTNDKTFGSWQNVIILSIIQILVVGLVFEILRRIFYYITLGSIKPKK